MQCRRAITLVVCMVLAASGPACDEQAGFRRITVFPGFGDYRNKYSWSMAEFRGDVYVGTLNVDPPLISLCDLPDLSGDPVDVWYGIEQLARSDGGEIWRYRPSEGAWTRVHDMEAIDPLVIGFRHLIVYEDVLYAGTLSIGGPAQIWSSSDGRTWSVSLQLTGKNQSVRSMAVVSDMLYAGTDNRDENAELWRFDGRLWQRIHVFEGLLMIGVLAEMDDWLYVTTWDQREGFSVYRYDGEGFERVVHGSNPHDLAVMAMHPFQGRLYMGTANFGYGFGLYVYDPATAVLEFVGPRGFGDPSNAYAWRLEEHRGRLYLGTFNTGVYDGGLWFDRGLQLWSSADGVHWEVELPNGIGNWKNLGVRSLLSTGDCLYLGTASHPFSGPGTEVFVREEGD